MKLEEITIGIFYYFLEKTFPDGRGKERINDVVQFQWIHEKGIGDWYIIKDFLPLKELVFQVFKYISSWISIWYKV